MGVNHQVTMKSALIFSDFNMRAVITLCRLFSGAGIPFQIVAGAVSDPIFDTDYRPNILFVRHNLTLNDALFQRINEAGTRFVYCPTSEYLNTHLLRTYPSGPIGLIETALPELELYALLTNKSSSIRLFDDFSSIHCPRKVPFDRASIPFIAKPKLNCSLGKTLYPMFCRSDEEFDAFVRIHNPADFFFQEFVKGQSFYLCAYVDKGGSYSRYWQVNHLQQPNGKSILLAETCTGLPINEERLFQRLSNLGYRGPIMFEFIISDGRTYFIEINPRFWGPLQLALDASDILDHFLADRFERSVSTKKEYQTGVFYAWLYGSKMGAPRHFPSAKSLGPNIAKFLNDYDVYNRPDTQNLHGRI